MTSAFLNGTRVDPDQALISAMDAGFALGEGVLETMVARNGRILRGHRHRERLSRGLEHLGLTMIDWDLVEARAAEADQGGGEALLRLVVTRGRLSAGFGSAPLGVPTELLTIRPFRTPPAPRRAHLVDWPRRHGESLKTRFKSLGYGDELFARRVAQDAGAEIAIMRSTSGRIASFDCANLFALIEGHLVTPPIADGALAGTVRSEILDIGAIGDLTIGEAPLTEEDLVRSDVVLLTNAGAGVSALHCILNLPGYAPSTRGVNVGERLQAALRERE